MTFGRRLKKLRGNQGYSQERLADIAGLHRTYIGGVERGERNVSLVNIWRIADALGTDPSAFFSKELRVLQRPSSPSTRAENRTSVRTARGRRDKSINRSGTR